MAFPRTLQRVKLRPREADPFVGVPTLVSSGEGIELAHLLQSLASFHCLQKHLGLVGVRTFFPWEGLWLTPS